MASAPPNMPMNQSPQYTTTTTARPYSGNSQAPMFEMPNASADSMQMQQGSMAQSGYVLGILNIITKSRLSSLNLVTVPKMPNLSLTPLKPSCHPQQDIRDAVLKYAIALLNK